MAFRPYSQIHTYCIALLGLSGHSFQVSNEPSFIAQTRRVFLRRAHCSGNVIIMNVLYEMNVD